MAAISKSSKLLLLINYRVRVTILDGRQMVGRFMAFDRHMNLVLGDTEEFRTLPTKGSGDPRVERRVMGLLLLRGDAVLSISVEGPPPQAGVRGSKGAAAGPGAARAAGRGAPLAAAATAAPAGLSGPAPGVGGPAPGSMMPRPPFAGGPPGVPPPGFRPGMPPPGAFPPPGFPPYPPPQ